jgi:Nitrous oxide-stimulated promoter
LSRRLDRRSAREERTITIMVSMYCRDRHADGCGRDADGLCTGCAELLEYARRRLAACRYGAGKPTCADCPTHCYASARRQQVRAVMRHAGPRMIREHPLLAVAHLAAGRRKVANGT